MTVTLDVNDIAGNSATQKTVDIELLARKLTAEDYEKMDVKALKKELKIRNIEFDKKADKESLINLLIND